MSVDISTLALRVESSGVATASGRLDTLAKSGGTAEAATNSLTKSFSSLNGYLATATAAFGVSLGIAGFISQVRKAIDAIDSLRISTIQVAAQIATMQGPKNVAENYKIALAYADALAKKLQEVDANSFANYETLLKMNQAMTLQGVIFDINNQKQVDAFTALSNAVAMYTAGQNQSIQAHQEIRALMTGHVVPGAQLAIQIDSMAKSSGLYAGGLKEIVAEGKKHGDTLERLAPFLTGINAASGDIAKTWQAVTSSMETAASIVRRAAFDEVFKDAVKFGGEAVTAIKNNAVEIADAIKLIGSAIATATTSYLAYLTLIKGPGLVAAIGTWTAAFYSAQVANASFARQVAAGDAVQLNSVQATAMKTAAQAELATTTAAVTLEEANRAISTQAGLVLERESAVAKLQNVLANDKLITSHLLVTETESAQAIARTAKINAHLGLIAKESAALAAKGALTKADAAFANELRDAEFKSRNKLIIATQEQAAAETALSKAHASAITSAESRIAATAQLTAVSRDASIATNQMTAAVSANEKAQLASISATEAAAAAATKARWAWLSLGNAVNVLFAGFIGWEIGQFLNKFEIVRKAGVVMVYGIIGAWHELTTAWDRFKATANPFGDEDDQRAKLAKISADYAAWMVQFKANFNQQMKDVENKTVTTTPKVVVPVVPPGATDAEELEKAARAAEQWRATYADLRKEIDALNPAMDEYSRKVADVSNKYTDLMGKKGANIALLGQLRAAELSALIVQRDFNEAVSQGKTEMDEYVASQEALAVADKAYLSDIANTAKAIKSLQPGAALDAMNEQIAKFQEYAIKFPEDAEKVAAAIAKLKSDFAGPMPTLVITTSLNMQTAMKEYAAAAQDMGEQSYHAVTNAFYGMEDALTKFVTTGKLDFRSLADSIIADLVRIAIKQNVTGPLSSYMSGKSSSNPPQDSNMAGSSADSTASSGSSMGGYMAIVAGAVKIIDAMNANSAAARANELAMMQLRVALKDLSNQLVVRGLAATGNQYQADLVQLRINQIKAVNELVWSIASTKGHSGVPVDYNTANAQKFYDPNMPIDPSDPEGSPNSLTYVQFQMDPTYQLLLKTQTSEMQKFLKDYQKQFNSFTNSLFDPATKKQRDLADAAEEINEVMRGLNMVLPATRNAVGDFVAGLDRTSDAFIQLNAHGDALITVLTGMEEAAKKVRDTFLDTALSAANALKDILGGDLSTLSPEEKYRAQGKAFADAQAAGRTAELPELGKALLAASRDYNASGGGYTQDYAMVTRTLADLAAMPNTADLTLTAAQSQVQLLTDIKAAPDEGNSISLAALSGQLAPGNVLNPTPITPVDSGNASYSIQYEDISNAVSKIKDFFSFPKFASGGITSGPSIAGEAGYPEAVVPLSGGRSIPVDLRYAAADNRETVAELKEQNALLRELLVEARATVRVSQAGLGRLVEQGEQGNKSLAVVESGVRLAGAA